MDIHIGEIIKREVKINNMSVKEFAEKINCSRRNVYAIFNKGSIDTNMLINISKVLAKNLFQHYDNIVTTQNKNNIVEEPQIKYAKDEKQKIEYLEREIQHLEEINNLLKERNKKL